MNLEGLLPLLGGIYMWLLATGKLPKNPKDPAKMQQWRDKFAPLIKILAPLVIIFGILQFFKVL